MGEGLASWALGSGMRACLVIEEDPEFWGMESTGNLCNCIPTSWVRTS